MSEGAFEEAESLPGHHAPWDVGYSLAASGPVAERPGPSQPARPPSLDRQPRIVAELVFPALLDWQTVLDRLGVATEDRIGIAAAAQAQRLALPLQAVADGAATEAEFYRAFAETLGLGFEETVDPARLALAPEEAVLLLGARRRGIHVFRQERNGPSTVLATAVGAGVCDLKPIVSKPGLGERLRIVPPSALRQALWARASPWLARNAALGLFERFPQLSARRTLNGWQAAFAGAGTVALPLLFGFFPHQALLGLHLVASLFFAGCVTLRAAALLDLSRGDTPSEGVGGTEDLPVYSVLVALYREQAVVPQLLEALAKLDWPAGRLDVKLVCEADDRETIEAIRRARPPPHMEVLEVPPGLPRTKPKALNYALPAASGEFVVLYDAEDRPHPGQLREAWARFREGGPALGCLQAPLVVSNGEAGYLARMFGFEYAALFRGLLPYLARRRALLPLGGTSNHFRRACLEEVGGWDPFNVTEDADLALRLTRMGWRTGILALPTLEDAPETLSTWLPQRVRWFKGWAQCWLVHMRDPFALYRELGGMRSFLVAQLLFAGLLVSALVHPFLVATFAVLLLSLLGGTVLGPIDTALVAVDALNISIGYFSFLALGWRASDEGERRRFAKVVLGTPVYWMLMSAAAWAALWQLWRRPHHWNKTPHLPVRVCPEGVENPN